MREWCKGDTYGFDDSSLDVVHLLNLLREHPDFVVDDEIVHGDVATFRRELAAQHGAKASMVPGRSA